MDIDSYPEYLKIDIDGAVACVTFNRPEQENRQTLEEMGHYVRFLREADADPEIRVVLQTGTGTEWFSAGGMLGGFGAEDFIERGFDEETFTAGVQRALFGMGWFRDLLEMKKPIITMLNGDVQGAPLTFALAADIILAERHVKMRDLHVPLGMSSSSGPLLWAMATGIVKAKRWVLTGDWFDAAEAESIGLITEVVDSGTGLEKARAMAAKLAALRPEALWITKRNFNNWIASRNYDLWQPAVLAQMATAQRRRGD